MRRGVTLKSILSPTILKLHGLKLADGTTGEAAVELLELRTGTMDRNGQPFTKRI